MKKAQFYAMLGNPEQHLIADIINNDSSRRISALKVRQFSAEKVSKSGIEYFHYHVSSEVESRELYPQYLKMVSGSLHTLPHLIDVGGQFYISGELRKAVSTVLQEGAFFPPTRVQSEFNGEGTMTYYGVVPRNGLAVRTDSYNEERVSNLARSYEQNIRTDFSILEDTRLVISLLFNEIDIFHEFEAYGLFNLGGDPRQYFLSERTFQAFKSGLGDELVEFSCEKRNTVNQAAEQFFHVEW